MSKVGMVFEGGGARGAYHIGVYKAYLENGYKFDGFVGTSVGAINAAALASNEFEAVLGLWGNISKAQIFDDDLATVLEWENARNREAYGEKIKSTVSKVIVDKGIDTGKMRKFIANYISEDAVRKSGLDVGLVTYSLTDKMPLELFISDIPPGLLIDYLMASSNLPGFKAQVIDDKKFLDGYVYDNLPINMLLNNGYDEIIAVRTKSFGKIRDYDKSANVKIVAPLDELAGTLAFSPENSYKDIRLGYFDGLKSIHNLSGRLFYIKDVDLKKVVSNLFHLTHEDFENVKAFNSMKNYPANRLLFEHAIPELAIDLKLDPEYTYEEFLLATIEFHADVNGITRYRVYDFKEFLGILSTISCQTALTRQTDEEIALKEKEKFRHQLVNIIIEQVLE